MRVFALLLVLALAVPASAQVTVTAEGGGVRLHDLDRDAAGVLWTQGAGEAPTEFRLYCNGALVHTFGIASPVIVLRDALKAPGDYTCHATAANALGETAPSEPITFRAGAKPDGAIEFVISELEALIQKLRAR